MERTFDNNVVMHSDPIVSIGLPVYNGESTIAEAIDSLLAQTFQDFEIIVCDNASTDSTEAIVKSYMEKDKRIRYYRSDINRGAAENFNWAFKLSRGEYFKWHAADDIILPDFLKDCIQPLLNNPDFVLCFPIMKQIRYTGETVNGEPSLIRYRQLPENQLNDISLTNVLRLCLSRVPLLVFGLIRTSVLAKTGLIGKFIASDHCLVYELRLHGRFAQIPIVQYIKRGWPITSTTSYRMTKKGEARWFGAKRGFASRSRDVILTLEMLKAYKRAIRTRNFYSNTSSLSKALTILRELLSFRAHFEIRLIRAFIIPTRRFRLKLFRIWAHYSESFLNPLKPNITVLRIWRIAAATIGGHFNKIPKLITSRESNCLLEEGIGRLLHRGNDSSFKLIADWLKSEDKEKAIIAYRAFMFSSKKDQGRLIRYLDSTGEVEARFRLDSLSTN